MLPWFSGTILRGRLRLWRPWPVTTIKRSCRFKSIGATISLNFQMPNNNNNNHNKVRRGGGLRVRRGLLVRRRGARVRPGLRVPGRARFGRERGAELRGARRVRVRPHLRLRGLRRGAVRVLGGLRRPGSNSPHKNQQSTHAKFRHPEDHRASNTHICVSCLKLFF